jgi:hypothetical protein
MGMTLTQAKAALKAYDKRYVLLPEQVKTLEKQNRQVTVLTACGPGPANLKMPERLGSDPTAVLACPEYIEVRIGGATKKVDLVEQKMWLVEAFSQEEARSWAADNYGTCYYLSMSGSDPACVGTFSWTRAGRLRDLNKESTLCDVYADNVSSVCGVTVFIEARRSPKNLARGERLSVAVGDYVISAQDRQLQAKAGAQ